MQISSAHFFPRCLPYLWLSTDVNERCYDISLFIFIIRLCCCRRYCRFYAVPSTDPLDHSNRIRSGSAGCSVCKFVFLCLSSSGLLPHAGDVMMKTCWRSWVESFSCLTGYALMLTNLTSKRSGYYVYHLTPHPRFNQKQALYFVAISMLYLLIIYYSQTPI
jgi:hypothetical protein